MKPQVYVSNGVLVILGTIFTLLGVGLAIWGKTIWVGLLFAAFGLMMYSLMFKNHTKVCNIGLCISFALCTVAGFGIRIWILGIFMLGITVLLVWGTFFADPVKMEKDLERTNYLRLFIVRDVFTDTDGKQVVIFSLTASGHSDLYFAYKGEFDYRFVPEAKFQMDIRKLKSGYSDKPAIHIQGYRAVDISHLQTTDFEDLSPIAEKLFDTMSDNQII